MKKTRNRQKLFIYGIVQVQQSCFLQLISTFSSPFFGVKFVYNYGHRTQITVSCMENVKYTLYLQDDGSLELEGFLKVHCTRPRILVKAGKKCVRLEQSPNL
jgi:hypothetical protein